MDPPQSRSAFVTKAPPDPRQPVSQNFGYPGSPSTGAPSTFRPNQPYSTYNTNSDPPPIRSPPHVDAQAQRQAFPFPQVSSQPPSVYPHTSGTRRFEPVNKFDDRRVPLGQDPQAPYNETVKRHLDVFDAELALNEVRLLVPRLNGLY